MRADDRPAWAEPLSTAFEEHHVLPTAGADRLHEAAADDDLRGERSGHFGKGRRHKDRVIRCVFGEALAAVTDDHRRIVDAAASEILARRLRDVGPTLDAPDLVREVRQQRRLPAVARPHFEQALTAGERQRVDHPRDERRLRRHLAVRDPKRRVEVSLVGETRRDELASRNEAHCFQQAVVGDSRETERGEELDIVRAGGHRTILPVVTTWPSSADELVEAQLTLSEAGPPPWRLTADAVIGGCFACSPRGQRGPGAAGDSLWAAAAAAGDTAVIRSEAGAPYRPGLLARREGPALAAAVRALEHAPDALLVDGTGRDHPRRAGLAVHLGAVLDLPTVGVTHRPLLAEGPWPDEELGERSPLVLDEAVVGFWLRTRPGTRPLAVHAAWRTDPGMAVEIVLGALAGHRAPEPLRRARRAAREGRSAAGLRSFH